VQCGNLTDFLESMNLVWALTLGCAIHQHVGEPTNLSLSTAGMYAGKLYATMGNYWYKPNLRNILLHRGEVLSDPEGLVVLKRGFTVSLSLLDVFSGSGVGVAFGLVRVVLCCFLTSSLLRICLLSNSLRSDRPCHELDRQSLQKKVLPYRILSYSTLGSTYDLKLKVQ